MPVLLLLFAVAALAYEPPQEPVQEKDKVHLISAQSAQLIEKDGENYRKVVGPAKFLHNDTYLLCDTALWNVNTNIIDATGNVQIIQDRTKLSSATLQYVVDDNMAKFRGELVQLEDSDHNTLRTRYLDYNTKDSVAIFQNGAAMRDKDGQIIESLYGTYDAKAHLFIFNDQVNMYMDTTFMKTSRLEYRSDLSTAYFGYGTDMWQDDQMLSADDGWYDRNKELYFFRRRVHLLTQDQEIWSDSLYYHRVAGDVEMLGNVEIMDTTRNVFGLAGRMEYSDSLSQIRMTRDPAIMSITEEKERVDTVYVGADILFSRAYKRCDIPEEWVKDAEKRTKDISGDPVMEYRKKAAEEAAKKAADALKNDPAKQAEEAARKLREQKNNQKGKLEAAAPPDQEDTTAVKKPEPAVKAPVDTVPPPPDTSKVNIVWGSKNVRLFRRDMQMAADSLYYTDLDSLVRLYRDPIFFNSGNRQYAADSIYMVIKNRQMQRAHLLSNAFITIEEAPQAYDQIRGTEMVAYFDSTNALTRFDALGGASSLFYLEENDALATVNKVEAKMIYATFVNDTLSRMYYYDNAKNDGYPTVQLPEEDKTLKGFRWEPERRPKSPLDVTALEPRPSERIAYLSRPHAKFQQTEDYFPGYINKVYRDIAIRDSLTVVRQREKEQREAMEKELAALKAQEVQEDTLAVQADTTMTALKDTLKAPLDSLAAAPLDSLSKAPVDSLASEVKKEPTPKELRQAEKARKEAEKARIRKQKDEERKARWAELDRRDAEKKAAKEQKKLEKERARKLKALQKLEKKAQKERARFERYLRREQERELRRQNKRKK
jgi:lipopolysaccharide export system protein LptA